MEERSFAETFEEVLDRIDAYTGAWKNRSPSDPGITILENLTAFAMLQRKKTAEQGGALKERLPGFLGFFPEKENSAAAAAGFAKRGRYPALAGGEKFRIGNCCFETKEEVPAGCGRFLRAVRAGKGGRRPLSELEPGNPLSVCVFGERPERGETLELFFDELPAEGGESELCLYVEIEDTAGRNPMRREAPQFARLDWSVWTDGGFAPVHAAEDETFGFLQSGLIRLRLGAHRPVKRNREGCVLRCTLAEARYDKPPRVRSVHGLLFWMVQRDTLCRLEDGREKGADWTRVFGGEWYAELFEKEAGSAWYQSAGTLSADRRMQGDALWDACRGSGIRAAAGGRSWMVRRSLGILEGYDGFSLELPDFGVLDQTALVLGVRRRDRDGRERVRFFRPGMEGDGVLRYRYDALEGRIIVEEDGGFAGCELWLAQAAVTQGARGNIPPGSVLTSEREAGELRLYTPAGGFGGRDAEEPKQFWERCQKEAPGLKTAVTDEDFASLAKEVPGLIIERAEADAGPRRDKKRGMQVTVRLYTGLDRKDTACIRLYREAAVRFLEPYRPLGIGLEIEILTRGERDG